MAFSLQAQSTNIKKTVDVKTAEHFFKTKPLKDFENYELKHKSDAPKHTTQGYSKIDSEKYQKTFDPNLQTNEGDRKMRNLMVNFDGAPVQVSPPDPSGAAGPDHYVQAINWAVQVFDKVGNPLTVPLDLTSFWPNDSITGLGFGDPFVMYDRHVDRWVITQVHLQPDKVQIAVSETNDPTGSYFSYTFNYDSLFPDYPKWSTWWDGYYMTSNTFDFGGGGTAGTQNLAVFERDKMLTGDPSAQMITLNIPNWTSMTLPANADGPLPPNGTPCYSFRFDDDDWTSGSKDQVIVYETHIDWGTPLNSTITRTDSVELAPYFIDQIWYSEDVFQPGSGQAIDGLGPLLKTRAQHMRWVGYNTIVLTQTVRENGRNTIRWVELRDSEDGDWYLYQEGTYAPTLHTDRWMQSAAMDENGNIALAYSVCSDLYEINPSLKYTGRLANDPLGQMTFTEKTAVSGQSSQENSWRWGDYSHMTLDPDGSTLWFTGEYMGYNNQPKTRIFAMQVNDFDMDGDLGLEEEESSLEITISSEQINIVLLNVQSLEQHQIDLIDINGRVLISDEEMPTDNNLTHTFSSNHISKGIYFVRIGNEDYQLSKRIVLL